MDLRTYYRQVREAEAMLPDEKCVVLVSLETPEGGRSGVFTEAPRAIAAKTIALGHGRLASKEESEKFHKDAVDAKAKYDREESAKRVQVVVVPSDELKKRDRS